MNIYKLCTVFIHNPHIALQIMDMLIEYKCIKLLHNMLKNNILTKLGLDEKESGIYLSLLEHGAGTVSDIAKNASLFRPVIYKTLPALLEKGLISKSSSGKRKTFVAESPARLSELVARIADEFGKALPEMEAVYDKREKRPIITFLEGGKGVTAVYSDIVHSLKKGDIFYRYSSRSDNNRGGGALPPNYRALRDAKQLERFVITNADSAKRKKPRLERAIKIIPKEYGLFEFDISQIIYGNKVAFIDDNSDTTIIIENPIIAEFQKKLFKILYSKL